MKRAAHEADVDDLVAFPCLTTFQAGTSLVCPDLVLARGGRRTHVEIVGFWTAEFLRRKIELYRAAGIADVLLCVDESRACSKDEVPADLPVVYYAKRLSTLAAALARHAQP